MGTVSKWPRRIPYRPHVRGLKFASLVDIETIEFLTHKLQELVDTVPS
jgi:hypothetical protein